MPSQALEVEVAVGGDQKLVRRWLVDVCSRFCRNHVVMAVIINVHLDQFVEYLKTFTAMSEAKKAAEAEKHVMTAGGRNSLGRQLYKTTLAPQAPVSVKCPRPGCPRVVAVRSPYCRETCTCLCGKRFCSHCGHLPHFDVSCEDAMAVEMQWVQWLVTGREAYLAVREFPCVRFLRSGDSLLYIALQRFVWAFLYSRLCTGGGTV
jgi:hypothetical protein